MIRGFKKRELHKYALSPDTVKPTTKGTVPLGSADTESNNHPLINSPFQGRSGADSRLVNDKLSKDVPIHKPLRDVNQILSILQRRNVSETCSEDNPQRSVSLTEVPPDSDTSKSHYMESVSTKAESREQCMVQETSSASISGCLMTHQLSDPPSFDLGI